VKKQNQLRSRQRRLLNHMGVLSHGFFIFWNRKVAILERFQCARRSGAGWRMGVLSILIDQGAQQTRHHTVHRILMLHPGIYGPQQVLVLDGLQCNSGSCVPLQPT
jgi:hypothetical protein